MLFTRHFTGGHVEGDTLSDVVGFLEVIPRPAGLARIALWDETTKLDERVASANAPTIQLQTPLSGLVLEGPTQLTWTASDADALRRQFRQAVVSYLGAGRTPKPNG